MAITDLPIHKAVSKKRKHPSFEEQKMRIVVDAVLRNNGNYIRAAEDLSTDRNTIARWMRKYQRLSIRIDRVEGCNGSQIGAVN